MENEIIKEITNWHPVFFALTEEARNELEQFIFTKLKEERIKTLEEVKEKMLPAVGDIVQIEKDNFYTGYKHCLRDIDDLINNLKN